MDTGLAERCWQALKALDPTASGALSITPDKHGRPRVCGRLSTTSMPVEELVSLALNEAGSPGEPIIQVTDDVLEVIASSEGRTDAYPPRTASQPHGWTEMLYQGYLPTVSIIESKTYKRPNPDSRRKIANCLAEMGVFAPLILNAQLEVIDGDLRLSIARQLELAELPVLVLDVSKEQAAFLRLILNRSAEFQSWRHDEVGDLVDSMPNLQPLLEPLGFFGTRLLPVSYFSKNLIEYYIDPTDQAQQRYRQEVGLAEWATVQRDRILDAERAREQAPLLPSHTSPKLFDLPEPREEDLLATYDPQTEIDTFVREAKETAFEADHIHNERK